MAQIAADDEFKLRQRENNSYRQSLVRFATGVNLDNRASDVGITRFIKQPAIYDDEGELLAEEVLETDEQLRERIWLTWDALGVGTEGWYRYHAINSTVAVKDAVAFRTGDAEITVYIQSETGEAGIPTQQMIKTVSDYLELKTKKILNDTLIIASVTKKVYNITGTIRVAPGASHTDTVNILTENAREFAREKENIGQLIPLSKVYQSLAHPDVISLDLTAPTADVITGETVVPYLQNIDIS